MHITLYILLDLESVAAPERQGSNASFRSLSFYIRSLDAKQRKRTGLSTVQRPT